MQIHLGDHGRLIESALAVPGEQKLFTPILFLVNVYIYAIFQSLPAHFL
jgi:hypothetical protein